MGQTYNVACHDCKLRRDLDKFYALTPANTRAQVSAVADRIRVTHDYRAALLVTFMAEHMGHKCSVQPDGYGDNVADHYNEDAGDFWGPKKYSMYALEGYQHED